MTKEKAYDLLRAKFICMNRANDDLCDWRCPECPLNYEMGDFVEQIDAISIALKALES